MDKTDKTGALDLEEARRWCLRIQIARIRRGVLLESASQKLSPNLHRELLAFAKIAQLTAGGSQRASLEPAGALSSAELQSQTEVQRKIADLHPEDRRLLRGLIEQFAMAIEPQKKSNENQDTGDLQEENDEDKESNTS